MVVGINVYCEIVSKFVLSEPKIVAKDVSESAHFELVAAPLSTVYRSRFGVNKARISI